MSDRARPAATAAIITLGCKLNIADSEAMARRLREAGWQVKDHATDADAVIVNTCSVTHVADQKSRRLTRMARRMAPNATVALTGCFLETAPDDRINALGADLVYRQPDQLALADKLIDLHPSGYSSTEVVWLDDEDEQSAQAALVAPSFKTRAFISAQEGCNDVCAFCIIPRTRGRERSKTVDWVVDEARKRQAEGVQEVVITGTQLGAYGRDLGDTKPYDLLKGLLDGTSIPRIRMSSLQPQDMTDELIGLWEDSRLCRHFHLALQSGSQSILERMRRRYSKEQYRDAVLRLRAAIPDVAITTDVIAGFPGESEAEFQESYDFCREMAFAGVHVFPYSPRIGTTAYKLPDQVAEPVKKRRVHELIDLADRMSCAYRERFLGSTASVLWETSREPGFWEGRTDTYVRVQMSSNDDLRNRLTTVRLTSLSADGLLGVSL